MKEYKLPLFMLIIASFIFSACPGNNPGDSITAPLPVTVKIEACNISEEWSRINAEYLAAKKYVILDLSDCYATDNTIAGNQNPTGSDMNIVKDNEYVKGIILPSSLRIIGEYTFHNCKNLTSVIIPDNVIRIETSAFCYDSNLTEIILPSKIAYIGDNCFWLCEGLTDITFPTSLQIIENLAFAFCYKLSSVTFEAAGVDMKQFDRDNPYSLKSAYEWYGPGTYTRSAYGADWTKKAE